jgi:GT2 family glycosyltransferase
VTVGAVILAFKRRETLRDVLSRLAELPFDEVLVADNDSADGTAEMVRGWGGNVRLVHEGENLGAAARNVAAQAATSDLLVMLDDDSWPLPGAIEELAALFERRPDLGVAGGYVIDVGDEGEQLRADEVGTFDWFLRAGRAGDPGDGFEAFFFPEGACMVRRAAWLEAGGCFAPYFLTLTELDLATRMLAAGWDVRYAPRAQFAHAKAQGGRPPAGRILHLRVRNQLWYFWLRFPAARAARRIPAYLLFDLVECAHRGAAGEWAKAIGAAWRGRGELRGARAPVSRAVARRAELTRGRLHLRLLAAMARRRLAGRAGT